MKKSFARRAIAALPLLLFLATTHAATFQWTNSTTGPFLTAANWTNTTTPFANGVPGTADTGVNNLPGSTTTVNTGDTVIAGVVQPQTGTLLINDGSFSATTIQCTGSNGIFAIGGGTVNLANLQITANFGIISISNGTTTVTTDCRIGAANGVWNVSGGATLNVSKLVLGSAAVGNINNVMTVSGNAVVTQNQGSGGGVNRELWIGGNNAGSGTLILKDNASWTSAAANAATDVIIGRAASAGQAPAGVLTIQDNASLVVGPGAAAAKIIRMADTSTSATGTLNLNGGNLSTIGIQRITGTATINANGGKVTALAATANSFFNNFTGTGGANSVNLQAGGLTFDTGGFAVTLSNVLSGAGGLTVQGGSTLTLARTNTYTGNTIVNAGTLLVGAASTINPSSLIAVSNSSTLNMSVATQQLATAGSLIFSDGTLTANFLNTNIITGTLNTGGTTNLINVTAFPTPSALPATVHLIKYTTAGGGLVDGGNNLLTLGVQLPPVSNPAGYLTNNTATKTIDLIITNMVLAPLITSQPQPDSAYTNAPAHFTVLLAATNAPTYKWRKDGNPISNPGHYTGTNTAVLRIANVTPADLGNYDVVITNVSGSVTSTAAGLTLLSPVGYEAAALAAGPVALYMFDETSDPATTNVPAFDYAGDLDGVYGIAAQNGNPSYNIAGPRPADGFTGFDATNIAARFFASTPESHVSLPPLNLNTNTVTFIAWINPNASAPSAGIVFCRGGGTTAGLNFTATSVDGNGYRTLGYTWNNEAGTFGWNSQIAPTPGQWSFVSLVITPTNATIYIFDATGLRASSQAFTHVNQSFSATTLIGEDGINTGNRQFDGAVDGVGVYAKALTQAQMEALFLAAKPGASPFAPLIWSQPASQTLYEQQTATFTTGVSGSQPLTYQWQTFDGGANYANVTDGGRVSGSTTPSLVISNLALTDATNFVLVITNIAGSVTSSVATLTVNAIGPAEAITNSTVLANGQDWNTGAAWSDGLPASLSAVSKPGSTYHVVPGGGLRTPNTTASASFPGDILTVYGDGIFVSGATTNAGALIMKGQSPGITSFKKLVMNGGQIFSFTDANNPTIIGGGELNIIANTPVAGLSATGGRSFTIGSQITGNGNVDYIGWPNTTFQAGVVTALNIAGTNNPYTGTWNVIAGTLVGSAPGALGTNTITVGTNAALQTAYGLNNTNGTLILNGRMNLTQNDTFRAVSVNGTSLAAGTYSFSQLASAYPANFPATWVGQTGADTSTSASGSLTVLGASTASNPTNLTFTVSGSTLSLSWPGDHLGWIAQSNRVSVASPASWFDIAGSQSVTNLTVTINPSLTNVFFRLRHP
jgi:autotransporter-associated beta strand protein